MNTLERMIELWWEPTRAPLKSENKSGAASVAPDFFQACPLVFRVMRKIQRVEADLYQAIFTHRFCGRPKKMTEPKTLLERCVGKWQGTVKTWFEPGKLADESKVSGEIVSLLNGNFFRHTYVGSMKGKPRNGEETLAMNGITKMFQISWFDDFHMSKRSCSAKGNRPSEDFLFRENTTGRQANHKADGEQNMS